MNFRIQFHSYALRLPINLSQSPSALFFSFFFSFFIPFLEEIDNLSSLSFHEFHLLFHREEEEEVVEEEEKMTKKNLSTMDENCNLIDIE